MRERHGPLLCYSNAAPSDCGERILFCFSRRCVCDFSHAFEIEQRALTQVLCGAVAVYGHTLVFSSYPVIAQCAGAQRALRWISELLLLLFAKLLPPPPVPNAFHHRKSIFTRAALFFLA